MSDAPAAPNGAAPAPRNNSGQFSPKAGATGVVQQSEADATQAGAAGATSGTDAPPRGPQSPDEWKAQEFEVDVYGEKQKVAWKSKAEAQRAAQELAAYRKRVRVIAERERQFEEFDRLPPEKRAELLGVPVEELARKKVLQAARMVDMTPEQRELEELREYKRNQAAAAEQARAEAQQREKQAARQQRRQQAVAGLEKGLELSGLPPTHHTMSLLAEIQQEATSQGLPELPPDLLAAEANRRYNERGVEPLKKLKGKSLLERLGPEVVREVLVAERERRGGLAGQPRPTATPSSQPASERELPRPTDNKVYGEAEANELLRAMRNRN